MELSYFEAAVNEVIGPYLERRGYRPTSQRAAVEFRRSEQRIKFSYDRGWQLVVTIRLEGQEPVDLWQRIAKSPERGTLPGWIFGTESGLRRDLERVIAILEADEWWADSDQIREAATAQRRDWEADLEESSRNQQLRAARQSYDAGEFTEAIAGYEALGEETLSAQDRRKLHQARNQLSG